MRCTVWLLVVLLVPFAALAQIDGANMVSDIERGYEIAKPCDQRIVESADSYQSCMAAQANKLPARARVQRQAFYFRGWLTAEAAPAGADQADALRQHFSERLARERGKSELPLKLMCRVARADCTGIESRLGLKR